MIIASQLNKIKKLFKIIITIILIIAVLVLADNLNGKADFLIVSLFTTGFLIILLFINRLDIILANKGKLIITSEKIEINYRSGKCEDFLLSTLNKIKIDYDGYSRKIFLIFNADKTYKFQLIDKWYISVFGKKFLRINFNHFKDTFFKIPEIDNIIDKQCIDRLNDFLN